jgi:hypothetical protein
MDKNQKLSRPEPSTVEPGKAAPVGQRRWQQPGKAETHVTLPHKQGNAETHDAPEKNG